MRSSRYTNEQDVFRFRSYVLSRMNGRVVMANDEFVKFGILQADFWVSVIFARQDTDPDDIADILLHWMEQGCSVVLLNYTKSGSRFWNIFRFVRSSSKRTYVGSEARISIILFSLVYIMSLKSQENHSKINART